MGQVDPRRIGYLYVHGVGRQHRHSGTDESTLRRMGQRSLTPISEVHGDTAIEWDEVPEDRTVTDDLPFGTPAHAWVTVRHPNGSKGRILMAEAVWSDRVLQTKRWSQRFFNLRYVAYVIPAILLLLGPDHRDRKVLFEGLKGEHRRSFREVLRDSWVNMFHWNQWDTLIFRFAQRIMILATLFVVAFFGFINFFWIMLALVIVGVVALAIFPNPVQQVVSITVQDGEREAAIDYLEGRLKWISGRCDEVVIVAHSQGAYLVHQLLLRDNRSQDKVVRFVAVGSGLKPLWFLRQLRDRWLMLILWSLPASMLLMLWGASPVTFAWLNNSAVLLVDLIVIMGHVFGHPFAGILLGSSEFAASSMGQAFLWHVAGFFLSFGNMTFFHGIIIAFSLAVSRVSNFLLVKHVVPRWQEELPLSISVDRRHGRPMEWQEFSSMHDAVGRWLIPRLPRGVEQEPVPVIGHPVRDHTDYFNLRGLLARKMSGSILADLERTTGFDFGANAWNESSGRYMSALREQHDRRRRFYSLTLMGSIFLLLLPSLAMGNGLISAVVSQGVLIFLFMIILSFLFSFRGKRSHQQVVKALDEELRGTARSASLVRVIPEDSRKVPALMLMAAGLAAFCGGSGVFAFATMYPQEPVPAPWGMVFGSIFLWVLAAAVQSGYPIKRWWLLAATVMTAIPVLTAASPSAFGLPLWFVVPGVPAVLVVAFACLCAAVSLGRAVPSCLPTRSSELAARGR
ncbi:hypothetical protein GTW20_11850 [Nocardiopsis alba]|uniref:Uncharacterized protein n=1 Tax=Nocardiopsis alba TaxID=53437 RepID=A0A7K2ISM3_9ACTN|nr:hypothetical protein [Nocardiopsis alba]MYR32941.1 hypothetical protein [Nocardiopsis alba]